MFKSVIVRHKGVQNVKITRFTTSYILKHELVQTLEYIFKIYLSKNKVL